MLWPRMRRPLRSAISTPISRPRRRPGSNPRKRRRSTAISSDPVWAKAQAIDEFYQIGPDPGQPATKRTVLRFLYDADNLYVAIYAYDSEPDKIVATNQTRDGNLGVDDVLRLYLDPLNTRRNSYDFEVNALGARIDALLRNNQDRLKEWNTIWTARAKIVADGYTVEMAIPFRDLSYDPTKPDWVIDLSRVIRRTGERIRWSSINPAISNFDISQAGTLTGISDINPGVGLDIQLYGSLRYRFDWQNPKREIESFRASGNAFYKFTPQLVGTLTVNPDFSDAPLDIRQVNTTRFVLFQPETRNFFLQDVATFEFGGHGFATADDYNYPGANGTPFFSRNIGLANNLPGQHCRRRQIIRRVWRTRDWRALGRDQRNGDHQGKPSSFDCAHHQADRRIEAGDHAHQWRPVGTEQEHGGRRRFSIPRFELDARQDFAIRFLLPA